MKILLIGCDTKAITSYLATVFKYKHENHGIVVVPAKANIEKLLGKTEAKIIISPSTSVFCRQINGGDRHAEKLINLLREKDITIISNDMLSSSDIEKVFNAALNSLGYEELHYVDKYALTNHTINKYSINAVNISQRTDIHICKTIEDAKVKVIEFTKAKIKQLQDNIASSERSIKIDNARIDKLVKSLGVK